MPPPIDDYLYGTEITPRESQGALLPWDQPDAIQILLEPIAFPLFINMAPLMARMARRYTPHAVYTQFGHAQRPSEFLVMASITNSATSMTVNDASIFQNGDVLELPTGEHVEVSADPNLTTNVLTVTRAMEGTTGTAITVVGGSEPTGYILANARTGAEEFQRGLFPKTYTQQNFIQTSQHPVEISGLMMDTAAWRSSDGGNDPLGFGRTHQLTNMMLGYARSFYYGLGASYTAESTKRGKTKGILKRLNEVGNVVTPSSGDRAAYTPDMLFRDMWGKINSGQDLLIMAPNFRAAMVKWKIPLIRIDMGQTDFNMVIESFNVPTFGQQTVLFDPQLRPGTAIGAREEFLEIRYMLLPTWFLRGRNGDAVKGDLIARMGMQVNNPELMTAITGVTGFAAP
jgi:hypothetical protein